MKHFRDLVLSTKEPAVKNVLWVKPTGIKTYLVLMYEDEWIPLFGGSSSTGISYDIIKSTSDGFIVLLVDKTDPNNPKNLYPLTKAVYVWLSNGLSVEETINNINRTLNSISLLIKKAIFVTQQLLEQQFIKTNNTYWVYSSSNGNNGTYTGEAFVRKYTSESAYTKTSLSVGDIIINLDSARASVADLGYVSARFVSPGSSSMIIQTIASKLYVYSQINNAISSLISDVKVDGDSVVTGGIANIKNRIRNAYLVTSSVFAADYAEGVNRANKTFLLRNSDNLEDLISLYKYDNTGLDVNRKTIDLESGDLLFNRDEHVTGNDDFEPYTLYVYDRPQERKKVHPLATMSMVEEWVGTSIIEAVESVKPVLIDFTASNERQSGATTTWDVTTTTTVTQIESYLNLNKVIYARISGVNDLYYRAVPTLIPLLLCSDGYTLFGIADYKNISNAGAKIYSVIGSGSETISPGNVSWTFKGVALQAKLTFDNIPTENSNNVVTSGGVYSALTNKANNSDLDAYVLLNSNNGTQKLSYNDRIAQTPKLHRVEFLDSGDGEGGEYDTWDNETNTGVITDNSTHFIDSSTHQGSAIGCFKSLWWAVMECNDNTGRAGAAFDEIPKLILRYGNVACYCWSDLLTRVNSDNNITATEIILKFFNGINVITYDLVLNDNNINYPNQTVIEVTKTTQAVTLT